MSIPETVMVDRCVGCAFRPGTEAARATWTAALRDLCVMAGVPFECHDGGAGHLCHGFVEAFTVKLRGGDYDRLPKWKRDMSVVLIDLLQDYREASERGESLPDDALANAIAAVAPVQDPSEAAKGQLQELMTELVKQARESMLGHRPIERTR